MKGIPKSRSKKKMFGGEKNTDPHVRFGFEDLIDKNGLGQSSNKEGRRVGSGPHTPPKTNMEPENGPLEKEIPIGNHHFQVPC